MENKIQFDLQDFSIKGMKSRDSVTLSGDIPFYNIAQAAELLIHSQGGGSYLRITAEVVKSEPGNLQQ